MQDLNDITSIILFQIDRTSRMAKLHSQRIFDEEGLDITVDQWVLLKILDEEKQLSQKELAVKSSRDAASITRTLDILERKGHLQRNAIANNRRQYEVTLTTEGKAFVKANMKMVNEQRQKSLEGLSQEEVINLRKTLLKIQHNFE